jgi:hypothetical protein
MPHDIVSCDRVYRAADSTLLGHVSVTRIYKKTWLLHQLSCLRGHPESGECRRMLYLLFATVPTVYDGDEGSVIAYFDQELRCEELIDAYRTHCRLRPGAHADEKPAEEQPPGSRGSAL